MTEDELSPEQEIFASLNITNVLIAILEKMGEVIIPTGSFLNAVKEDRELQVDYNSDDKTFIFKLKSKE